MKTTILEVPPPPDHHRKGTHLSDLIKYILKTGDPKRYGGAPTVEDQWYWELGLGWEYRIWKHPFFEGHKTEYQQEVKFKTPMGLLHLTPDIKDFTIKTVVECKLTDLSSREPITDVKYSSWRWQAMAYDHVSGWNKALFVSHHQRGNYADVRKYTRWVGLEFEDREIAKNWTMLMNAWEDMKEQDAKRLKALAEDEAGVQTRKKVRDPNDWDPRWSEEDGR